MTKFEYRGGDYHEIIALLKKHRLDKGFESAFEYTSERLKKAESVFEQKWILNGYGMAMIAVGQALERAEATGAEVVK